MSLWSRIANVFRSRTVDRDIAEELASHFEEAHAVGRDPAEASRAFGSRLRAHEAVRDAIVAPWLDSVVADAVFGWRQLLKHKTTSAAAILSLALGIGSCTAAFRLIDALFLRPLQVADPGSLYVLSYGIERDGKADTGESFDYPGFRILSASVRDQADLMAISYAGFGSTGITYGSEDEMERVARQYVDGRMFAEFGLQPVLGRLLTAADDVKPGAHPYAVLSYEYWSRRFRKDARVLGRTFRNGNDVYQIVGVAPKGFTGTENGTLTDLFVPMMMNARAIDEENHNWFRIWVRLKPGANRETVRQKLQATLAALRSEKVKSWPAGETKREVDQYVSARAFLESAAAGFSETQKVYRRALVILGVLVALVLLIACANVANLMTAQAASRAREMALRVSIGAGRARLIQLVLLESALMAIIASLLGIIFAWWAAPFVVGMIGSPGEPVRLMLPADWRVTSFAVALTFAVTLLFGLAPALRASSVKPVSALKGGEDPHSRRHFIHALVAVQVAFCFLVHFVAGLFVSTFERLASEPTGFSSDRVLTLEAVSKAEQPPVYWRQALSQVRSLPGVESAALSSWALMTGNGWQMRVWANGHTPDEAISSPWFLGVSPGWFETMRVPLLDGRDFRPGDTYPRIAVVNEAFERFYFAGHSPVGRMLETVPEGNQRIKVQIVGLVGDARYTEMRGPIPPTIYVPFGSLYPSHAGTDFGTFLVRTKSPNPMALASILRHEIPRARPEFRVSNIRTQEELVRAQTLRERMLAMLSLFFATVALLLAGVGLYGVLDYAVVGRRREFGIRIALGAPHGDIARRVTIEVFSMLLLGSAAGLALGLGSERYISTLLYQVKATDLPILTLPALTILSAALLAALPPVLRAIRIDPSEMLRAD